MTYKLNAKYRFYLLKCSHNLTNFKEIRWNAHILYFVQTNIGKTLWSPKKVISSEINTIMVFGLPI
jgi:hypothetical protein